VGTAGTKVITSVCEIDGCAVAAACGLAVGWGALQASKTAQAEAKQIVT
jgi:hypothetical protein